MVDFSGAMLRQSVPMYDHEPSVRSKAMRIWALAALVTSTKLRPTPSAFHSAKAARTASFCTVGPLKKA